MKSHSKIICFLIVALLGGTVFGQKNAARAKTKKPTAPRVVNADAEADFTGGFDGGVYKNRFFGVKMTMPESWLIQERQVSDAIKDAGTQMVKGKTTATDKAYQQAVQRLTVLFTASKDILGIENNATMIFSAEKSTPLVQVRNGRDYLRFNIQSFKKLQLPPDFKYSETIAAEKFGAETFYSLDVQRATFQQRFYATYRKGYALFFTLTYANQEDLETMKEVLRNSDFAWKE